MARTPGAKNKNTIVKTDSEDIFLADCLERYTFWKAKASEAKEQGRTGEREIEYAQAFKVLFNRFSSVENDDI